ncbi:MAG: hypothetical protein H0T13_07920, partial [Actinobacteria bacterium]|nr:hypothetical protein [Actinomycetota bacterium]
MRVQATSVRVGAARHSTMRAAARWILVSGVLLVVLAALLGLAFAGSSDRLAEGVTVAGVDVGGLSRTEA